LKFKQTANKGIRDHGAVAPLVGVHEVVQKVPDSQIGFVDLTKNQVLRQYVIKSSTSAKDLDSLPLLTFSFNNGGNKVTDMIMYDTKYFVFILDQLTINLVTFSP
jgi:hypothetical protein